MKMLVTGAAGFLGGHLVEQLLSEGHEVRGLVRDLGKGLRLKQLGVEVVQGDVSDLSSLNDVTTGIDIVFHVAAYVSDWGPWSAFQSATVNGTTNMLTVSVASHVRRFLHVSTAVVYDDRTARRLRVVSESAPQGEFGDRAYGSYAKAKVMAEQAVWRCHQVSQLPVTVIRPTWVYGPRDFTILPRLIEHLESPFACWVGGKNPVVDPIYVTDVAACASLAAINPVAIGQAYNVAPDREIRLREFLGAVCQEMKLATPRWSLPLSVATIGTALVETYAKLSRSLESPAITKAALASFTVDQHYDPAKAMAELSWRPQIDLANGARLTADWLRSTRTAAAG